MQTIAPPSCLDPLHVAPCWFAPTGNSLVQNGHRTTKLAFEGTSSTGGSHAPSEELFGERGRGNATARLYSILLGQSVSLLTAHYRDEPIGKISMSPLALIGLHVSRDVSRDRDVLSTSTWVVVVLLLLGIVSIGVSAGLMLDFVDCWGSQRRDSSLQPHTVSQNRDVKVPPGKLTPRKSSPRLAWSQPHPQSQSPSLRVLCVADPGVPSKHPQLECLCPELMVPDDNES